MASWPTGSSPGLSPAPRLRADRTYAQGLSFASAAERLASELSIRQSQIGQSKAEREEKVDVEILDVRRPRSAPRLPLGRGAGGRQYRHHRHDPADDRPAGLDRQAGTRRRRALHSAAWRHGRRQEDRARGQGRHRRGRRDQAPGGGADRQRSRQGADGFRADAARAGHRAGGYGGEGSRDRQRRRDRDDHREIALYRPHLVHASAGVGADGRVGGQERDQEGRHHRRRLRPRRRRREMVLRHVREGRRNGRGKNSRAAQEPGLRALPAAREGRRARRGVRVRAVRSGRDLHEGVRRARPRQVGRSS